MLPHPNATLRPGTRTQAVGREPRGRRRGGGSGRTERPAGLTHPTRQRRRSAWTADRTSAARHPRRRARLATALTRSSPACPSWRGHPGFGSTSAGRTPSPARSMFRLGRARPTSSRPSGSLSGRNSWTRPRRRAPGRMQCPRRQRRERGTGEQVAAGKRPDHRRPPVRCYLQRRVDEVAALNGHVALLEDLGRAVELAACQVRAHPEPRRSRTVGRVARNCERCVKLAPDAPIDELRLLHAAVAGVQQAGRALLLTRPGFAHTRRPVS